MNAEIGKRQEAVIAAQADLTKAQSDYALNKINAKSLQAKKTRLENAKTALKREEDKAKKGETPAEITEEATAPKPEEREAAKEAEREAERMNAEAEAEAQQALPTPKEAKAQAEEPSNPKEVSLSAVLAKAARMEEAAKSLRKVEELAKQVNAFEVSRGGQEAAFEMTDKAGNTFKTANTYLCEAVLRTLKAEITKKAGDLERELKALY